MGKIKAYILIVWLSFKWIWKISLGDKIIYNDKEYVVHNGITSGCWTLLDEDRNSFNVKIKNCKKVWSLQGMMRSFKSGYNFYMTSWYNIWVTTGIKPWMRGCSIWGDKRK